MADEKKIVLNPIEIARYKQDAAEAWSIVDYRDLGAIRKLQAAVWQREEELTDALTRISALEEQVEGLRAALEWAYPLARITMESCRLERLKNGHHDIGAGRERNKTEQLLGLWDSEVAAMDQAAAALSSSPEVKG